MAKKTLPHLLETSADKFGSNTMMLEKTDDHYVGATYSDIRRSVHTCAAGLMSLGIQRGDRIALISEGRNDWVIAEFGILYTGAVNVPLSVKIDELSELKFRLAHSGCRAVIASGSQVRKLDKIKNDLPDLEKIILLDDSGKTGDDEILFAELLREGERVLSRDRSGFDETWRSVEPNDPANICYTSGTTADPKGIVLTHLNYYTNVEQASAMVDVPEYYCSLLILPWDHSFAHTAGVYALIRNGASMAAVELGKTPMETLRNIPVNIRETRPAFLLSVPALAKSFKRNIEQAIKGKRSEDREAVQQSPRYRISV
jgi:long-chain acyl-CoA synthetase